MAIINWDHVFQWGTPLPTGTPKPDLSRFGPLDEPAHEPIRGVRNGRKRNRLVSLPLWKVAGPFSALCAAGFFSIAPSLSASADETNPPVAVTESTAEDTNTVQTLRALTEFESQLKANQSAIEESRQEARESAAQSADLLAKGLQTVEETFSKQQRELSERYERELMAVQSSNRVVLILGGIFAAVASLALLLVAYFQWRMTKLWSDLSLATPVSHRLGMGWEPRELGAGEGSEAGGSQPGDAGARLLQALERLETRVHDLERGSAPLRRSRSEGSSNEDDADGQETRTTTPAARLPAGAARYAGPQVEVWLEQAQAMAKQNDWDGALNCFNEVLNLEPKHGEALVKKGSALEHLKRMNEAFECYDRAIAADDSMTIAYLHKGGLCSRLERFKEALDCYEKALKTHDGW